jgi:hypothetical protein
MRRPSELCQFFYFSKVDSSFYLSFKSNNKDSAGFKICKNNLNADEIIYRFEKSIILVKKFTKVIKFIFF